MLNKEQSPELRSAIIRGRWSGRSFQPQNIPRGYFEEVEEKLDMLVAELSEGKNNDF